MMFALPVQASSLPSPTGPVLLTVSGEIEATNAPGEARFDIAMLEEMGGVEFSTSTIWTSGVVTFTGVPLDTFLDELGASGSTLEATAINDYVVSIPTTDAVAGGPMIAYKRDGDYMSIRDKGPLWIVYPYDKSADYQSELIYSRSIWQLDRIKVVD